MVNTNMSKIYDSIKHYLEEKYVQKDNTHVKCILGDDVDAIIDYAAAEIERLQKQIDWQVDTAYKILNNE